MATYTYSPSHWEDYWDGKFATQDQFLSFLQAIDTISVKEHWVQLELSNPYAPNDGSTFLEGLITQGSISVNGNSAIRRTGSLTMTVPDATLFQLQCQGTIHKVTDLNNLIAINKRAKITITYKPLVPFEFNVETYESFSFPLGTFVLQNPSVTYNNSGVQVQVKLSDPMVLLNGTESGELQMAMIHSPVIGMSGEETNVKFKDLITTLVSDFGGITNVDIDVPEVIDSQIYRWANSEKTLYAQYEVGSTYPKRITFTTTQPTETKYDIFELQDLVGVKDNEPFTYPGELASSAGESIMSVLDKIKKTLGNYEYFFDIDGVFHFQEIKNGLNDGVAPDDLNEAIQEKYFGQMQSSKAKYDLTEGTLISSYVNTPKFDMVKNNIVCWGKNNNTSLGIRYHLLIDRAPAQEEYTTYYCQWYMDDFGINRIFTASTKDTDPHTITVTPTDWRQLRYLQAIAKNNQGLTALEKEIIEEWPKIYDVIDNAGFFYDAKPEAFDYWLDMIDVTNFTNKTSNDTLIMNMSIPEIGDRPKSYNDDKVNCIFAPNKAIIRLFYSEDEKAAYDIKVAAGTAPAYEYYWIAESDNEEHQEIIKGLGKGVIQNPAFDYIRSVLHEHIAANNSVSLQTMPLYHLEPNMRIAVENDEADIHGEYIINSLTMPLTANGMMTIQASKAVERI